MSTIVKVSRSLRARAAVSALPSQDWIARGTRILSRDGSVEGALTGARSCCRLEGCCGLRVSVKWNDGSRTRPCTKALRVLRDGAVQIV